MNRLVNKIVSSVLATSAAASLAACGGGSHSSALPQPAPTATAAAQYTGPLANATLKITIPVPTSSSSARRPSYVSSATSKVVFTLNSASNLTAPQVTALNSSQLGAVAVTLGSGTCPGSGPWTCTITIKIPPGTDNITVSAQDSSSNILSQQIATLNVVAGGSAAGANNFAMTLDANASTMALNAVSGQCAGAFTVTANQNVPTVGTNPVNLTASFKDLANKAIVGPGLPVIGIKDTASGTFKSSGTITNGTGSVTFSVNQAAQSITLTASGAGVNVPVQVQATAANTNGTSDGLAFTQSLSFNLLAGAAEPAGLLAAIEQTNSTPGSMAGQVDLLTLTNPTNPTGFGAALASSPLTPYNKDIDNPQDMLWDSNGDLLIANGGAGNPDFGNFACIPAGAVVTPAANTATVVTTNADDPISVALGTDNSAAVANHPGAAPYHLQEYILNPNYVEASPTREISNTQVVGMGANNVVALPTSAANPAGTYAIGLSNGANPPASNPGYLAGIAPNQSQVTIKHPDGTTVNISDNNNTVVEPYVGYDPANAVLVVASGGACNATACGSGSVSYLNTYTVGASPTLVSSQLLYPITTNPASSGLNLNNVAVSANGYVAVAGATAAQMEVQVYDKVLSGSPPARAPKGAPIPFDGTTTTAGTTYAYDQPDGLSAVIFVNSIRFLGTSDKLLIGVQSKDGNYQGFYLYDVTTLSVPGSAGNPVRAGQPCNPCYDSNAAPFGAGPTMLGFYKTTNHPLAAAYKP